MKITILGSGGGEGYPALFCNCEHCNVARRAGGKSIRTLSQTLINDDLLIDLPYDTAEHFRHLGHSLGDVPNILITHTHEDHFIPILLSSRGTPFAHNMGSEKVTLYGSSDVARVFDGMKGLYTVAGHIDESIGVVELKIYEPTAIGRYTVTALPAKHARNLVAYNYLIEEGSTALLYLHDSGYPEDELLSFVSSRVGRVDCVMMDATMGVADITDDRLHMSFHQNKRLAHRLAKLGIADDRTRLIANHITHNNAETHDKIEQFFSDTDIIVSYDGMVVEV